MGSRSLEKQKILVVIPSLHIKTGVAAHVMNYYNNIHDSFGIDFATYRKVNNKNTKKILDNGGKIFYFEKRFFRSIPAIKRFFKEHANEYQIIHCHTFNYGIPYLYYAKKYGIGNRILHIHSVKYSDNIFKATINKTLIKICSNLANIFLACSRQSGKKAFSDKDFTVINNCINLATFASNTDRNKTREMLGVKDDEFLFGNVGRLVKTKNQSFLVEVLAELKKIDRFAKSKLLVVGDGPEYENILKVAVRNKVKDDVIFENSTDQIRKYYAAMDCFIFPSKYEGLGIVTIEAQASGLHCFCSNTLPDEVFATGLAHGLNPNLTPKEWAERISENDLVKLDVQKQLTEAGFDIRKESKRLVKFYSEVISSGENRSKK